MIVCLVGGRIIRNHHKLGEYVFAWTDGIFTQLTKGRQLGELSGYLLWHTQDDTLIVLLLLLLSPMLRQWMPSLTGFTQRFDPMLVN